MQQSGENAGIQLGMELMKMDRSSNERHQVMGEDKIRRRCQKCNPIVLVSALDNWTGLTVSRQGMPEQKKVREQKMMIRLGHTETEVENIKNVLNLHYFLYRENSL